MIRERLVKDEATGEYQWVPLEKTANLNRDERKTHSTAYHVPLRSTAAGVHPRQVNEFNEMYKSHNIAGAYHDPTSGDCFFESNHARNEVLKLRGLYDADSSYGQWAGNAKD